MNKPIIHHYAGVKPDWWRREGETWSQWDKRKQDIFAEWQREQDAIREALAKHRSDDAMSADLAVGVGTYDGNGNPKGSGWW